FILSKLNFPMAAIKNQNSENAFGTAFILSFRIGILSLLISIIICLVFKDSLGENYSLVLALCLINFLKFPSSVLQAFLEKDFKFKNLGIMKLVVMGTSMLACLIAASNGLDVWSLLIKDLLLEGILLCFLMYHLKGRVKREFNQDTARVIWSFSRKAFLLFSFEFIYDRVPRLFIGKLGGDRILGFFERSHYLSLLPNSLVLPFTEKVSYSYFSKQANLNIESKSKGLQISLYLLSLILLPLVVIALFNPSGVIMILLGPQWIAAQEIFRGAVFLFLFIPVYGLCKHFLMARGEINKVTQARIISCLFLALGAVLSYKLSKWYLFTWMMSLGSLASLVFLFCHFKTLGMKVLDKAFYKELLKVLVFSIIGCWTLSLGGLEDWLKVIISVLSSYSLILILERRKIVEIYSRIV
ncbi:MAG: oligosaccharide flippase family protein, partial [Lentisphaeraceae bacterium]|nr:oligosaccharide flippase family protein [Lentisphaeraceae bacterium]